MAQKNALSLGGTSVVKTKPNMGKEMNEMKSRNRKTTQLGTGEDMKRNWTCPTCKRHGKPSEFYATVEEFTEHFSTHIAPACYTGCGRPAVFTATIIGVPPEISPTGVLHPPCCLECAIERGFAIPEGLVVA